MKIGISAVMPVYNGERYLLNTLESLVRQSYQNFEVICINDASTDRSSTILSEYAGKINLSIINLESNIGLVPYLIKNYGIPNLRGEYFTYLSQDDFLSDDCFEKAYHRAQQSDADVVIPDFVFYKNSHSDRKIIGLNGDREVVLQGLQAFKYSLDWSIPGAALYRLSLIKKVGFEDFNMYADEYSVRKFFLEAKTVVFSEGIFFYRTDNPDAITKRMKPALFGKLYKEVKLLELVFVNADKDTYNKRLEQLINMFYDYTHTLLMQDFTKSDFLTARKEIKSAFSYFNELVRNRKYKFKSLSNRITLKYSILRTSFAWFFLFCRFKFFIRHSLNPFD